MGHGPLDTWKARIGGAEDERETSTGMRSRETRTRTEGSHRAEGHRSAQTIALSVKRKRLPDQEKTRGGERRERAGKERDDSGRKHSVGTGREERRDETRNGKEGREGEGTILSGADGKASVIRN